MCGFVGFIGGTSKSDRQQVLSQMTEAIRHRGPDDQGLWFDDELAIALGHRRLAIIDLSPNGHQPMISNSGRFVVVFNGEIYNHKEILSDLEELGEAPTRRGHSDTETMLAAFELWGVIPTLSHLNGMFSFAVWDHREKTLTIARDRMGEKPLYFGHAKDTLLFGSELKALRKHPSFVNDLDPEAISLFLKYNYVPSPWSIWKGINKLPPASYAVFDRNGRSIVPPTQYWNLSDFASAGVNDPLPDGPELSEMVSALLDDAVKIRMEADVPLGAFLSGGIDSSTVVASMQAQSERKVKTFSIGFNDRQYNEAQFASAVARHLSTDHTELYVTPADALNTIPNLPVIWDEPFSDSSQIPTLLVSQMTRQHVTVALSGDGGDELFGGYSRYSLATRIWPYIEVVPPTLRPFVAKALRSPTAIRAALLANSFMPRRRRFGALADRMPKVAHLVESSDFMDSYHRLIKNWNMRGEILTDPRNAELPALDLCPDLSDPREAMMFVDSCSYLPDDILTKVDRASMAVSLEARVPFLDHRLVELAWRVPMSAKIRNGQGKHILRELLYQRVPRRLIDRPKMGFSTPIEEWLSGPLRPWAEELLDEAQLIADGIFNAETVRKAWDDHVNGRSRNHYFLWNILMFQAWWKINR